MILDSKKTRTDIISNAKFIVNKGPARFKGVVIVKDLTPSQSEFNKQRREEYRNKKKQLNIQSHKSISAHTSNTEVNNSCRRLYRALEIFVHPKQKSRAHTEHER